MEAGGAGTASWGDGRDEIEITQSRKPQITTSQGSQGSFREEEGLDLTGVFTGSFCCHGDTMAWGGVGPAWGHSAGTFRPDQGLSRPELSAWESKVQPGWGSKDNPGTWPESALGVGGRCGRGLNPALPGAVVGARNGP